ncbi:MAG: hypothetical protein V9E99_04880 [Microthrixaceae bacterium]
MTEPFRTTLTIPHRSRPQRSRPHRSRPQRARCAHVGVAFAVVGAATLMGCSTPGRVEPRSASPSAEQPTTTERRTTNAPARPTTSTTSPDDSGGAPSDPAGSPDERESSSTTVTGDVAELGRCAQLIRDVAEVSAGALGDRAAGEATARLHRVLPDALDTDLDHIVEALSGVRQGEFFGEDGVATAETQDAVARVSRWIAQNCEA